MRVSARSGLTGFVAVGVMGGYGFVQSQGGWSEFTQMPARCDGSTPETQAGFQLLGIARVTPEERAPRLPFGDGSLGGSPGLVGSTRVWFRLPPPGSGERPIPKDDDLNVSLAFPDGATYNVRWEMADLGERVASFMIPAGYPQSDWVDLNVQTPKDRLRWRLSRLPKMPRSVPTEGESRLTAEGVSLALEAESLPPPPLNTPLESPLSTTGYLVAKFSPLKPLPKDVRVWLRYERIDPEFRHPAELRERPKGEAPTEPAAVPSRYLLAFPYADRMKVIGVKGRLEVRRAVRSTIEFPRARWRTDSFQEHKRDGTKANVTLTSLAVDRVEVAPGLYATVSCNYQATGKLAPSGSISDIRGSTDFVPIEITGLVLVPTNDNWRAKVEGVRKRRVREEVPYGKIRATVVKYELVRTIPFSLVAPVHPVDPKATVPPVAYRPLAPATVPRPRAANSGLAGGR